MRIHPAADIFPLMSDEEFNGLVEDIRLNGLQEPIVLTEDGVLLDGRNRRNACEQLGIEPARETLSADADPIQFVLSRNLHRRHLSTAQRALVGTKLKEMFEEQAKERQRRSPGRGKKVASIDATFSRRRAVDDAAKAVNVSPASVERASRVLRDGVPELVEAMEQDRISVSAADNIATLPAQAQRELLEQGPEAIRKRSGELSKRSRRRAQQELEPPPEPEIEAVEPQEKLPLGEAELRSGKYPFADKPYVQPRLCLQTDHAADSLLLTTSRLFVTDLVCDLIRQLKKRGCTAEVNRIRRTCGKYGEGAA